MTNTSFDWQIDEFMVNCRSRQLREKTMASYEQALRLFERWCKEQMMIDDGELAEELPRSGHDGFQVVLHCVVLLVLFGILGSPS